MAAPKGMLPRRQAARRNSGAGGKPPRGNPSPPPPPVAPSLSPLGYLRYMHAACTYDTRARAPPPRMCRADLAPPSSQWVATPAFPRTITPHKACMAQTCKSACICSAHTHCGNQATRPWRCGHVPLQGTLARCRVWSRARCVTSVLACCCGRRARASAARRCARHAYGLHV